MTTAIHERARYWLKCPHCTEVVSGNTPFRAAHMLWCHVIRVHKDAEWISVSEWQEKVTTEPPIEAKESCS